MKNFCEKKNKREKSLFSWLLLSDVVKVFRYSFSEAMPIFFKHFKGDFFPSPIAIKFSSVINHELKFVKMQV